VTKIDNRIEIIVGAKDLTGADLADLRRRLDEFGRKVATAKVDINDKAAQAKLLLLAKRFDALNKRVTPEIDLRGFARAEVQLAAMAASLAAIQATGGGVTFGAGILSFLGQVLAMGPQGVAIIAALAAALVVLVAALVQVAAAVIPITLGFAGLAAVAVPLWTKITTAVGAGRKAIEALPPAQEKVAKQMEAMHDQWAQLNKAIQPEILKAFGLGIRIINQLMPALKPLMEAAGKAVDFFLRQLLDWLKSPSGRAFLNWLEVQGPHDIKVFGKIMWDVAHGVGDALQFIYHWALWLGDHFRMLFTVIIPAYLDIWKEEFRIAADKIEILVLDFVNTIVGLMAKLPGPFGAPFKAARITISGELGKMQADVRAAMGNIQNDINRLHGKNVTVQVGEGVFSKPGIGGGFAGGTSGAAPGWAWVGERGPELVKMGGGETVIPNHALGSFMSGAAGRLASAVSGISWPSASNSLTLAPSFHYTPRPAAAMTASGPQVVVQPVVVRLEIAADAEASATEALMHALRKRIRTVSGGDVQKALGRK
jgi:hypothetical protein